LKETTWIITPTSAPLVIRNCNKCDKKMAFYCSEKFRLNGNHTRIDIWLIYKCAKCDTTWKLTIKKGIKPRDIPPELFDRFINNDKDLAWKYAFDRHLLKQMKCEIDYSPIEYQTERFNAPDAAGPLRVRVISPFPFYLKLSVFLAKTLGTSVNQIKKLTESGAISVSHEKIINEAEVILTSSNIIYPKHTY
jgi:hypothetical protein